MRSVDIGIYSFVSDWVYDVCAGLPARRNSSEEHQITAEMLWPTQWTYISRHGDENIQMNFPGNTSDKFFRKVMQTHNSS